MPYSDSIYLINQDFIVFEIKYNNIAVITISELYNFIIYRYCFPYELSLTSTELVGIPFELYPFLNQLIFVANEYFLVFNLP